MSLLSSALSLFHGLNCVFPMGLFLHNLKQALPPPKINVAHLWGAQEWELLLPGVMPKKSKLGIPFSWWHQVQTAAQEWGFSIPVVGCIYGIKYWSNGPLMQSKKHTTGNHNSSKQISTNSKMLEWFGLEGTFQMIQFQPPAMGRVTSQQPRVPSRNGCDFQGCCSVLFPGTELCFLHSAFQSTQLCSGSTESAQPQSSIPALPLSSWITPTKSWRAGDSKTIWGHPWSCFGKTSAETEARAALPWSRAATILRGSLKIWENLRKSL